MGWTMATRVFICWSGDQSHQIAHAIKTLLENRIDRAKEEEAIFVSDDVEKGVAGFESLLTELTESAVGIVCVTVESLASPWMHFEAGALARKLATEPPPTDFLAAAAAAGH